jgi:hypothetical protein
MVIRSITPQQATREDARMHENWDLVLDKAPRNFLTCRVYVVGSNPDARTMTMT